MTMFDSQITSNGRTYRVGGRIVSPSTNEIIHDGHAVRLEPKSMEVLLYFIGRAGTVVSRDELEETIWAGVTVGDDSLTNAVIKIRRAFEDDARRPRIIETIPKRGYRLIAPVEAASSTQITATPIAGTRSVAKRRRTLIVVFLLGVSSLLGLLFTDLPAEGHRQLARIGIVNSAETTNTKTSIEIRPFINMSGDPRQDYLARGVEETIRTDLSRLSRFGVKMTQADDIRSKTEASRHYVLEGSLLKSQDQLRISTRLADPQTGEIIWSHQFDRSFSDLIAVQDEIHRTLIAKLALQVDAAEKANRARGYTENVDAFDLFLRAQQSLLPREKSANEAARNLYRKAITLDPQFARAYAGLALTYAAEYRNRWTTDRKGALANALRFAEAALEISNTLPQQHWVIAYVRTQQRQHDLAQLSLEKASALDPNFADAYALLAGSHTYTGNPEKSVPLLRLAMRIRPRAGYLYFVLLGRTYYFLGDCQQAEINLNEALKRNPSNLEARLYRAACLVREGKSKDFEWEIQEIKSLYPNFTIDEWISTYPMTAKKQLVRLTTDLRVAGLE
jgi:DNA-binding winged helix-turn-helix (wHTH) protein/TolB-like protein/Flp pilus assembly protein TadD